jgi:hypothetical protein
MRCLLLRALQLISFAFLLTAENVFACAVCGVATEASRKAFIYSTAILSLVPLAMIGVLVYYLFRASQRKQ